MGTVKILEYGFADAATQVEGKFLQLQFAGNEYLLFAPKQLHRFHSNLLAHFLEDRELSHHWENEQTLEIDAAGIEIVGGGKFRLDRATGTLELYDNSQAFGRFDDRGLIERLKTAEHWWSGYEIRIS